MFWKLFINKNMWMDIYGCILLRGLKTGYRDRSSNTDVADAVTRSSADSATEYGCESTSTTWLDRDTMVRPIYHS